MAFHRLTVPVYSGGLRGGDDYINNAIAGTPAPADSALGAGTYLGSYFFAPGEQVTGAAVNRGLKALAQNCDFLDDAIVDIGLDLAAETSARAVADAALAADIDVLEARHAVSAVQSANFNVDLTAGFWRISTTGGPITATLPAPASCAGWMFTFKDVAGLLGTSPLTIAPNGAESIDGAAGSITFEVTYGRIRLFCDGTNWWFV
jgi:hypothetical protein